MKPDWKDAPEWANYLAVDNDGVWYWYECKPFLEYGHWDVDEGDAEASTFCRDWKDSLTARPK